MDYQNLRLTPASYIVLGLLAHSGEATPYQLKGMLVASVGNFWSLQHAQLYSEPERLRRKRYRLTDAGRVALHAWVSEPSSELPELRDVALLKLFFGAAPRPLAAAQLEAHREKLREYEQKQEQLRDYAPPGPLATLAAGIAHEREWVRYWERLRDKGEV